MHFSNAIRQRILDLMKLQGFSLLKLSKASNVSYTTIVSFMNGTNKIVTLDTLYNLCIGLNIGLCDFFDSPLFVDAIDEHERNVKN